MLSNPGSLVLSKAAFFFFLVNREPMEDEVKRRCTRGVIQAGVREVVVPPCDLFWFDLRDDCFGELEIGKRGRKGTEEKGGWKII